MFRKIMKKITFWYAQKQIAAEGHQASDGNPKREPLLLSEKMQENLKIIKELTGGSSDIVVREFCLGGNQNTTAALVFIDGMVNTKVINESIIKPLMHGSDFSNKAGSFKQGEMADIKGKIITVSEVQETGKMDELVQGFLSGDTVLMVDGMIQALIISSKGWEKRSVTEPASEVVVRGPREGFTENLRTNTALLRRKIKNPALMIETLILGEKTRTTVCIAYIKGVANEELIQNIKERLDAIKTDSILESGYIEQYIEDAPFSLFATIGYTEKPDVAAAKLLEGRAAILVDGTPIVLTAPMLFVESFQAAEDYYSRPYYITMLRLTRYIAFFTTVFAPGLYVAVTTFHQELLPTELLFTMAAAREGIPFPAIAEALIMIITFEILREAGVRLPRPIGQSLSIVGALVIGEAAVSAGLIGAPMVIVIAITAVSIFVVPNHADTAAVLRVVFLLLGGVMGGYGIISGVMGVLVHMGSLKSFGFPYLAPIAPFQFKDNKDILIRAPLWMMISRPKGMAKRNQKRREYFVPPAKRSDYNSETNEAEQ